MSAAGGAGPRGGDRRAGGRCSPGARPRVRAVQQLPRGSAILADGRVFTGVNVENASYPLSVCAERNASAAAVMAGSTRFDAVAVVTDDTEPTPPCGGCRQVLHEFGPEMLVVSEVEGGRRAEWSSPGAAARGVRLRLCSGR